MRQIKFRAWVKRQNYGMIFGYPIITKGVLESFCEDITGSIFGIETWFFELMQYTGLKDKNDKEIYEGDILRLHYSSTEVVDGVVRWFSADQHPGDGIYGMETAKWVITKYLKETGDECNRHVFHMSVKNVREIIGNIYENSELLT